MSKLGGIFLSHVEGDLFKRKFDLFKCGVMMWQVNFSKLVRIISKDGAPI